MESQNQDWGIAKLAEALSKAQAEIKPPLKNRLVDFVHEGRRTKYSYSDLADCIEAVRVPLSKNGLSLVHQLIYESEQYGLKTTLIHSSGESLSTWYPLPEPSQVKPQQFGSALTYGRRYSLSSLLGFASEDDDDGAIAEAPKAPAVQGNKVSEAQLTRLFAIQNESGWTKDNVKEFMKAAFNIESSKDLERLSYDALVRTMQTTAFDKAMHDLIGN